MEERILDILRVSRNNGLTKKEVYKKLGHNNLSYDEFEEVFYDLQERKKIYQTGKESYTLNPFKEGEVKITKKGKTLVITDEDTIEITEDQFHCVTGDRVKIRITDFNERKGTIKEVIDRKGIIAETEIMHGKKCAVTKDGKIYELETDENIIDGIIVGIKIQKGRKDKEPVATIDKIFGHKNRPRLDEETILYENNFNYEWPEEVKEEVKNIPSEVQEEDKKGRKDLRDEEIFTIDGIDTKDIDDAISLKKLENGNYLLGVHIADVTNYVKEHSAIDGEAYKRGTSVYMNTVVNPMYPVELSNGICSLNSNVDRLALSCQMELDSNGNLKDYDIFESIIKSKLQMNYTAVNKILNDEEVQEEYKPFEKTLKTMYELTEVLEKNRKGRGYQEFDVPEIKVITDDSGKPIEISRRSQGKGEKLIEMFMLQANETVATYVYNMNLPFVYRVHDKPNEDKLKRVTNIIKSYGENIVTSHNIMSPKYIEDILVSLKGTEKSEIYSTMLLRSLAKATYESYNIGHFSIGIDSAKKEAYTHFTSPIRRYPDSTVHRLLKKILHNETDELHGDKNKLTAIAKHSTVQEQNSDNCERQSNKMKTAEYMEQYIGEEYEGKISGFTPNSMFVELPNLIEGRVSFSSMDDFYSYDEEMEIITGENNKKVYRLGDKVKVTLVRASKELREIDFELK
ncbi:MAG: ribonuclease R [Bacilli bacterium]|nr:ribonuclease R [Bacilli bacterium]